MSESKLWRVTLVLMLLLAVPPSAALSQEEEEEPVQAKPNPMERVRPAEFLPAARISSQIELHGGRSYLPVADLARALGGPIPRPGGPGDPIHLQPGNGGLLRLDPSARPSMAGTPDAGLVKNASRAHKAQKVSGGTPDDSAVKDANKAQKVMPGDGSVKPWSRQQAQPSQSLHASLFVGATLISRGIIIINGQPLLPVDDLGAALGARIVHHGGALGFEKLPGASRSLDFGALNH
jgi:hypothetical protein